FGVLPFLALAVPFSRWALPLLVVVTLSMLANLGLHDDALAVVLGNYLDDPAQVQVQLLDSWLNLLIFAGWPAWLLRPLGRSSAAPAGARPDEDHGPGAARPRNVLSAAD